MYIVEWTGHESNLNQRTSDNKADADMEAAKLEKEFGHVAILWETEAG